MGIDRFMNVVTTDFEERRPEEERKSRQQQ